MVRRRCKGGAKHIALKPLQLKLSDWRAPQKVGSEHNFGWA